ncbi:hypothetical protein IWW36_002868 [Coemansia brasiliensis]|uniref:Uncharacterized protein n=1 Tax=Coemansia brasiliensis TaxID=2650707 RepID=A0A9W8I6I1_9FUNG|nr:hypothetical protein IWW36_002868 [Coemansia brasiliensis]
MCHPLPVDILRRVLGIVIDTHPNHIIRGNKQKFLLLHVCQLWRYTAIPLVYKTAYIRITNSASSNASEPYRTKSNIDFVQSQGMWQLVKRLNVTVLANESVAQLVDVLVSKLAKAQLTSELGGIKRVELNMDVKWPQHGDRSDSETKRAAAAMETAAFTIASMMPHVSHLEFNTYSTDVDDICKFGQNLISQFATSLNALKSDLSVPLQNTLPIHLAHLHLSAKTDAIHILYAINPHMLKTLRLLNLPLSFSWSLFAKHPNQTSICFDNLCELALLFAGSGESEWSLRLPKPAAEKYKLRFPKLRRLHVDRLPSTFGLLFAAEFPEYLASLHVEGMMKSIGLLEQLKVKQIGLVRVEQQDADAQSITPDCYNAINHVFGSNILLHRSLLSISHIAPAIEPYNVSWMQLQQLKIAGRYEISTIGHLLKQTPRLKHLHMDDIVLGSNHDASNLHTKLSPGSPLISLNCQLEQLSVDTNQRLNKSKLMDAVLNLVAQLPMLKRESLPLLAVSRLWRSVATPLVHSWAIVECVEDYITEEDSETEDDMPDELWLTNFTFFDLYVNPVNVRKVHFYHEAPIPAYDFLAYTTKLVCSYSRHLCNVNSFEFSFLPASGLELNELGPVKETLVYNLSTQLVNTMPNLTRIETVIRYVHREDKTMLEYFTNIIRKTAHQLKTCRVFFPLQLHDVKFSDNLENMGLILHPDNYKGVPAMDTSTVKCLFFDNMSENFPWHLFQNPLTPGFIIFNSIRCLYLRCDMQPGASDNSWSKMSYSDLAKFPRFRFPNLKSLNLELCYDSYLYILRDWKATHLVNLHLTGSISHIKRFPYKQLQSVDHITLFISQADLKDQEAFYNITNHIFTAIDTYDIYLNMLKIEFDLDPSRINWPNITAICLPDDVELSTAIAITEKLPKLKRLEIGRLAFNKCPKDIENLDSPSWRQLVSTPINTKLLKLDIFQSFSEEKVGFSAAIALYLIICIKSLQRVFVSESVQEQMAGKMAVLEAEYPHIRNIKIYSGVI